MQNCDVDLPVRKPCHGRGDSGGSPIEGGDRHNRLQAEESILKDLDSLLHPLKVASADQSRLWPEVRTSIGDLTPDWIVAEHFFGDQDAIEEYLRYEGGFHKGTDSQTCGAFMMVDYCYIFTMATVPLFIGSGIVPDLSPRNYAIQFYVAPVKHDGQVFQIRRGHVRFLSGAFWTDRSENEFHADMQGMLDRESLCERYRQFAEEHFKPLVSVLSRTTGLSRNALWRLVADAIAGRFLEVGRRLSCLGDAKAAATAILKQVGSPLHNRQLHYFDLTLRDEEKRELVSWTFRARGGCCRYYTVEGGELCETCVLKAPADRDAELLEMMRQHFTSLDRTANATL